MKLNSTLLFFLFSFLFFNLSSCSRIPGKLLIIEGNFHNSRGNYDRAIISYQKALDHTAAKPYAEYGLGSVYLNMGEIQASLSRFAEAQQFLESASNRQQELLYRIFYNTGIALFSDDDFSGAADSFREALKVNEKKIEAKRNLELSLLSFERQNTENRKSGAAMGDGENEIKAALFNYILQKEIGQWRNQEWPEEEETGPDY